jgi:hypothetical protein
MNPGSIYLTNGITTIICHGLNPKNANGEKYKYLYRGCKTGLLKPVVKLKYSELWCVI